LGFDFRWRFWGKGMVCLGWGGGLVGKERAGLGPAPYRKGA